MPHYRTQAEVDAIAATATMVLDNDHSLYNGATLETMKATSPWAPRIEHGKLIEARIVWADLRGGDHPPVRVLVVRLDPVYHSSNRYGYRDQYGDVVDHVIGHVERADGKGFSRMVRHVVRGDITRGYEKARKLGLAPTADEELSEKLAGLA